MVVLLVLFLIDMNIFYHMKILNYHYNQLHNNRMHIKELNKLG